MLLAPHADALRPRRRRPRGAPVPWCVLACVLGGAFASVSAPAAQAAPPGAYGSPPAAPPPTAGRLPAAPRPLPPASGALPAAPRGLAGPAVPALAPDVPPPPGQVPGSGSWSASAVAAESTSGGAGAAATSAPVPEAASTARAGANAGSAAALGGPGAVGSLSPSQLAERQLQALDTTEIRRFVQDLSHQLGPGAGFGWQDLESFLRGQGLAARPQRLLAALLQVFAGELRGSLHLLGELLVLVVFAAVLRQIQGAFEGEVVARAADAAVFLALGAVCLVGFALAVRLAQSAVLDLSSFMVALMPALIGLLAATGAPTTAGLLHPALVAALGAVSLLVRSLVFPLLLLAAVLDIVGAFSPQFRLSSLSGLMRQVGLGVLGLLLTVFLGVVAVQGAAGAVTDGVGLRAAKYATRAFVPVVGGLFADAAEVVLSSGLLLKGGLGLLGLVAVALMVAVPVMKMLALWLIYRLSGALAQPVGGEAVAQVLSGVAATLGLLTVSVAAVGLTSFLSLSVLVGAGSAAFALR